MKPATEPSLIVGIGDLHGYPPALDGILNKLNELYALFPSPGQVRDDAQLVFCGDYIDRGLESKQLIERIMELEKNNPNVTALAGNHELLALAGLDAARELERKGPQGQRRLYYGMTVHGYNGGIRFVENFMDEHGKSREAFRRMADELGREGNIGSWLRERPSGIIQGLERKEILFVHGGVPVYLHSREQLEGLFRQYREHMETRSEVFGGTQQKYLRDHLVNQESLFWIRDTPQRSREDVHEQLDQLNVAYVVFGHTPRKAITMVHDRLFDIDVGMSSAYGGRDPAAIAFTKEGIFAVSQSQEQPEKLREL